MRSNTASSCPRPSTRIAIASPMASTDSAARHGRRSMLRRIMRPGTEMSRARPNRSMTLSRIVGRKLGGGSGCIATAGGSRTTRRTAPIPPMIAAPELTSTATMSSPGAELELQ